MTRRSWLSLCLTAMVSAAAVGPAAAQAPHREPVWELSGGIGWTRGVPVAAADGVELQANGNPLPLFLSETRLDNAVGAHLTLARHLAGPLGIEADGALDRSVYRTRVIADFESAAGTIATNSATTYSIGGALVATLARHRRLQPFVRLGAGARRELSADRTLLATGRLYFVGGGIKYWIGGPVTGRFGLRVEADAVGRTGGLLQGDATRFAPGLRAGCLFRF